MNPRRAFAITIFLSSIMTAAAFLAQRPAVDAAFEAFWSAGSPAEAEAAIDAVIRSGAAFDDVWARLKAGRRYTAQETGIVWRQYKGSDGIEHHYAVNVPENYDPARRYQVRFQLHGGIGRSETNAPRGNGSIGSLAGADQIYVLPNAWIDAPWWGEIQVRNLRAIVDQLKRTYNIDENRVVVAGVSDGATGAYFIAMRDTTPYAGFLPLNGFMMVLAHPDIDDGNIFPNNLLNKPMFVVNGGRDRLYPTSTVEPYVRYLMNNGVDIAYHPQPEGEHNTRWWPEVKDTFENFVSGHPRDPDPDALTWETAGASRNNRAHWLVIDKLDSSTGDDAGLRDLNVANGGTTTLFERPTETRRVDLRRNGNIVEARMTGVHAFTLLLSPDRFDFNQPIKVIVNGRTAFDGRVEKSLATLLKWAARDNDRTMLYGAELHIPNM